MATKWVRLLAVFGLVGVFAFLGAAGLNQTASAQDGGCQTHVTAHGGFKICPLPNGERPLTSQSDSDSQAEYYCGWGVSCWADVLMAPGVVYTNWYGQQAGAPYETLVEQDAANCDDPSGCFESSWWYPPNSDWEGAAVDVYNDDGVQITACWCGDQSDNCDILY